MKVVFTVKQIGKKCAYTLPGPCRPFQGELHKYIRCLHTPVCIESDRRMAGVCDYVNIAIQKRAIGDVNTVSSRLCIVDDKCCEFLHESKLWKSSFLWKCRHLLIESLVSRLRRPIFFPDFGIGSTPSPNPLWSACIKLAVDTFLPSLLVFVLPVWEQKKAQSYPLFLFTVSSCLCGSS